MIDLYYWPTPNGWKISILVEECALPYRLVPVNMGSGEQFAPGFMAISPNNRMPAIVDHAPQDGGAPLAVFESGAILQYLAEKTGRFLPADTRGRFAVMQWVMWQMGGLGPMAGQNGHFLLYAPDKIPYAIERYGKEVDRLYGVLEAQLARTQAFVAGADYSIADMSIFPWVRTHKAQQVDLGKFPHVQAWYNGLFLRPAVKRGLDLGKELRAAGLTEEARKNLFGQTAQSVREAVTAQGDTMIEFFFDCSSPWTYLAFHNLQPMAAALNEPVSWRPILVGGVFNAVNPSVYTQRENPVPAKRDYMLKDMQDWANVAGLKIVFPPRVFPVNSVKAMRGCIWLDQHDTAKMLAFATAVFEAYWSREEDISQDAVLAALCDQVGVDSQALLAGITQPAIKEQLKTNTDELIRRGGFGSPTLYLGDDMYFGNDRLELLRAAVVRARA